MEYNAIYSLQAYAGVTIINDYLHQMLAEASIFVDHTKIDVLNRIANWQITNGIITRSLIRT